MGAQIHAHAFRLQLYLDLVARYLIILCNIEALREGGKWLSSEHSLVGGRL